MLPTDNWPLGEPDHLSADWFTTLTREIEAETGIKLPPAKQTMIEGRLRRRARALECPDLDTYVELALGLAEQEGERVHLIDALTTNKTDFFREPAHFAFLQDVAVPALVRLQGRRVARIKVWSAACSTGAEAYTCAMVLRDLQQQRRDFAFSILGTDICTEALAEADLAIYSRAMMEPVPPDKLARYVMQARDTARDEVRITPELRRTVRFEHLNLMDASYPFDTDVDIIFCRNVLIYFDKATQRAVIGRLASHLRPGGFLLVGHAESMAGAGIPGLSQVSPTVFQSDAPDGREPA